MSIQKKIWRPLPLLLIALILSACGGGNSATLEVVDDTEIGISKDKVAFTGLFHDDSLTGESLQTSFYPLSQPLVAARGTIAGELKLRQELFNNAEYVLDYVIDKDGYYYSAFDYLRVGETYTLIIEMFDENQLMLFGEKEFVMDEELIVDVPLEINTYSFDVDVNSVWSLENENGQIQAPVTYPDIITIPENSTYSLTLGQKYIFTMYDGTQYEADVDYTFAYNWHHFGELTLHQVGILWGFGYETHSFSQDRADQGIILEYDPDLLTDTKYENFVFSIQIDRKSILNIDDYSYGVSSFFVYVNSLNAVDGQTVYPGDWVYVSFENYVDLNAFVQTTEEHSDDDLKTF